MGLFAALILAGCASVGGPPASRWQALADQAATALHVGPVYVDERPYSTKGAYRCREMRLELGTKRGDPRYLLAHELAHHVRRDCGESLATEMEANALAVTILQVWGATPDQAARTVAAALYWNRRTINSVHDYCAELRDLL
ncbi:MAG: hypothetical protein Q7W02_02260 [Candidatus Rokubacteria bacterium]|nr:hypothetical protein [Candidatus Rokubacteria bacterium]